MLVIKEILPIYLGNEDVTDLIFNILLNNNSFTGKLQKIAEDIAKQAEVTSNE